MSDSLFGQVKLLLLGDAFTDSSWDNHTVTATNATISTTAPKFGTGSMLFDGTTDYVTVPYSASLETNSSDFTLEIGRAHV